MKHDSSAARIAGNLLSGDPDLWVSGGERRERAVRAAVETARAIVAETRRAEAAGTEAEAARHLATAEAECGCYLCAETRRRARDEREARRAR